VSKSDIDRPPPTRQPRTGPRQFLREVRGEMKRVAWPSRKEVVSYSTVVLVTVAIMMALVFALDSLFGQFVLWIFG
jgi:preprotein translocase subunit SecE